MPKSKSKKPWGIVIAMLCTLLAASYILYFLMIYQEQGLSGFFGEQRDIPVTEISSDTQ